MNTFTERFKKCIKNISGDYLGVDIYHTGQYNEYMGCNRLSFKLILSILSASLFWSVFSSVNAQEYRTDYQVEYTVQNQGQKVQTKVAFIIKLTNYTVDKYVKTFSMSFPGSYTIRDVTAKDDYGPISPQITQDKNAVKISADYNSPAMGRNSESLLTLEFTQDNLFLVNGNVWEVILPTIENRKEGDYKIVVNLPENDKKISIAKPVPTFIRQNQIVWQNPETKTIYAVFGDSQTYEMKLTYNLFNPKSTPIYTEIALPPDTLYQKTTLTSLVPPPKSIYQDLDGNLLARYDLNSQEKMTVHYSGLAQVYVRYRDEVKESAQAHFQIQKEYLLSPQPEWEIRNASYIPASLTTARQIHNHTVASLQYDYSRLSTKGGRLGAQAALMKPTSAVCTEFTDVFVALAREKGVYARELQGYGFANDPQLRPLSLTSDVLHAWPEYYDTQQGIWRPIDPTWENTSGIDYFSSFDLNHIVFAIHGKDAQYPLPAGMYKTENTKDISVAVSSQLLPNETKLKVIKTDIPGLLSSQNRKYSVAIQNAGSIYAWNVPVKIIAGKTRLNYKPVIDSIAPGEMITVPFTAEGKISDTNLEVYLQGKRVYSKALKTGIIPLPAVYVAGFVIVAAVVLLLSRKNK